MDDQDLINTLLHYDCHIYGDLLSHNILTFPKIALNHSTLIECSAPHSAEHFLERSLPGVTVLNVSPPRHTSSEDINVVYCKTYEVQLKKKKVCIYITYTIGSMTKTYTTDRGFMTKNILFDVDLLFVDRLGLGLHSLPPCYSMDPNPFFTIYQSAKNKMYKIISDVPERMLSSEAVKNVVCRRIHDKKMKGWKNAYVEANEVKSKKSAEQCAICLDYFTDKSVLFNSGVCSHNFHLKCMESLIKKDLSKSSLPKCPLCRVHVPIEML